MSWGAESTGRCLRTLGEIQDVKRVLRCNGVRTVRHYPVKNGLSLHCSQIALFQKVVKELLLLNKIIKLFFKDLQR